MKDSVVTNAGAALVIESTAFKKIEFTKIALSSRKYAPEEIKNLTTLLDVRQTSLINKVTTESNTVIVESGFDNQELTQGYYIETIGVYGKVSGGKEVLFSVSIADEASYISKYNGITNSGVILSIATKLSNAENISLSVNPAAYATQGEVNQLTKQLAELDAEVDEIASLIAENDIVTSMDLAEFASGADTDVLMRHENVNEVFARDLGPYPNLIENGDFERGSYRVELAKQASLDAVLTTEVVDGVTYAVITFPSGKTSGSWLYLSNTSISKSNRNEPFEIGGQISLDFTAFSTAQAPRVIMDIADGNTSNVVTTTPNITLTDTPNRFHTPLTVTGPGNSKLTRIVINQWDVYPAGTKIYISQISVYRTQDEQPFSKAPEDLGIVHGQPNILNESDKFTTSAGWLSYREAQVTVTENITDTELSSHKCSRIVSVGGTHIMKYYRSLSTLPQGTSTAISLRARNNGTEVARIYVNAPNPSWQDVPPGEIAVINFLDTRGASTVSQLQFRAATATGDLDLTVSPVKLILGTPEIMDEWTPSQADSGLTPVNNGYYQTTTANTVIYGSQGSQRIHADLRSQAESKLNHEFPDFLERASDLKLLAKVQCADGFQVIQGDTVLFESDATEETSISVDLPMAEVVNDVYIRSKRASDGVTPVIITVTAQLTYSLKMSLYDFVPAKKDIYDKTQADQRFVSLSENQTVGGVKNFLERPQLNGVGLLASGEVQMSKVTADNGGAALSAGNDKTLINHIIDKGYGMYSVYIGPNIVDGPGFTGRGFVISNESGGGMAGYILLNRATTLDANTELWIRHFAGSPAAWSSRWKLINRSKKIDLAYSNSFKSYNDIGLNIPMLYIEGNTITVSGTATPTKNLIGDEKEVELFTMPVEYAPLKRITEVCQGSTKNSWLLTISESGKVTFSRYGTTAYTNCQPGQWLPYTSTWNITS